VCESESRVEKAEDFLVNENVGEITSTVGELL